MKTTVLDEGPGYFFFVLDLLIAIVVVMAAISIGMMLYGAMQFIAR